ncbi:hypothetical protein, partial [Paenarthrobacter nicotinovorans]|uniref:hypothetical protein n=1 Tax=Paenarthrobacter nicotinovorans TaxID=29320 RepID=UPI0024868F8A
MNALLIVMLLAIAGVVGNALGRSQGRRAALRDGTRPGMPHCQFQGLRVYTSGAAVVRTGVL